MKHQCRSITRYQHASKKRVKKQTLKLIADELGVPLSYFFCEDVDSAELVCLIDKLNVVDKKNLIDHIKKKLDGSE